MKITLVKDWDTGNQPPVGDWKLKGHFAGRRSEVSRLTNDIVNREEGAFLVSGYRGVGKTSFVYKCLSDACSLQKDTVVVLLTAAQLEGKPKMVIQNLVRRLYASTEKMSSIKRDAINALYRKAVSEKFSLKETMAKLDESSKAAETEQGIEASFSEKNVGTFVLITSWTVAVIMQLFLHSGYEWLDKLLPLLFAVPIPFGFNLLYKKKVVRKSIQKLTSSAEELYEFDNSPGNLEYDLNNVHTDLYKSGHKVVYVIDEVDKLTIPAALNVFVKMKNLLTLSKALFVFIGDEELYNTAEKSSPSAGTFRPKEYTYFTHKYFIGRPSWGDLSDYIDEIVQKKDMDESTYKDFKHSLLLDSQNDFFDLLERIRDRVTSYEGGHPIIELDSLSDEDVKKARLHKAVVSVFEEKYKSEMISKWQENELIVRVLLAHANEIAKAQVGLEIPGDQSGALQDSAKRDFDGLLSRMGALTVVQENHANVGGLSVQNNAYRYEGVVPRDPPEHLTGLSELEQKFLNAYGLYCDYLVSILNSFRIPAGRETVSRTTLVTSPAEYLQELQSPQVDVSNPFSTGREIYLDLTTHFPPAVYKRDRMEQATANILNQTKILTLNMRLIFMNLLKKLNPNAGLQDQLLSSNNNLFTGRAQEIRDLIGNEKHTVVFNKDVSRQVLLVDKSDSVNEKVRRLFSLIQVISEGQRILAIGNGGSPLDFEELLSVSTDDPSRLQSTGINVVTQLKGFFGL